MKKLAIVTSHPIQYNAPLFKLLSQRKIIELKVFYSWGQTQDGLVFDPDFKKSFKWDIPLLEGYEFEFIDNLSNNPGANYFNGIRNKELIPGINKYHPDAILVYGWSFRSHLQCLRYFHNKIFVYFRGDSTLLDESAFGLKSIFKKLVLKWIYSHVDKALYAGQNNKAYFQAFGLKDNQLVFAPHAIENERFHEFQNINFRQQLGIAEHDTVFLFAGKLEPKKNPGLLIDAFLQLNNPNAYLVMVGNGQLEEQLKLKCRNLEQSVHNRIKFMDFQNQSSMPDVYKLADVVVLPSKGPGETWGLAVNEAMASGRAVLISDKCGCLPDLIIDGFTGYSFESGNSSDLISKMNLMLNKEKTKIMGLQASEFIRNWSFEKVAIVIESLLNKQ